MNPISINRDGQEFGPFSPGDIPSMIASGQLVATDLAWHAALPDWQPLGTLPEFAHFFQPAAAAPQSSATARYLAHRDKARAKQKIPKSPDGSGSKTKVVVSVLVAVLLLALAAGYIVATAMLGSAVETAIKDNATSEDSFDPALQYEVVAYDRGFLHSTADIEFNVPLPTLGLPRLPVHLHIYHGPLLTGPGGTRPGSHRIVASLDRDKLPQDFAANFAGENIAQLNFESDLSGNIHIEATISGSVSGGDGGEPAASHTFSGASASLDANSGFTAVTARAEWGELNVADPVAGSKFHMAPVVLEADIPEIFDGNIVSGSITLSAPELSDTDATSEIKMTNLQLVSITATRSGKLRNDISFKLDNLTISGDEIPVKIDGSANFSFGVRGVDAAALARARAAKTAMEDAMPDADTVPDASQPGPLRDYANALADLLQPGLGISADAGVSTIGGNISLDFDLGFEGDRPGRELETLGQAINALEGTGRARLAKVFVTDEGLIETIAAWREDGTVADLGDKYSITFSMRNGDLRLNGQPMELPSFIQESIDEPIPWELLSTPSGPSLDDPPVLVDPTDLGLPMPDGEPADPGQPPVTPGEENMTPDDAPIPYDPTRPDEENMVPDDDPIPYDPTRPDEENTVPEEE